MKTLFYLYCFCLPLLAAPKPNIIFIYTDDQRWDAMGVVQREQGATARFPWCETPNMDRLAAEGVRFRNAFVTLSLCSPSRAAFLTGRYNHLNGVINNSTPFPVDSVTYATLLRDAGYRTSYFGKWHMGSQRGQRPGFDYSASFVGQGSHQNCPVEINGVLTPTTGWTDDVSTDYAIDWIKKNHQQPFLLVLGFKSPHTPRGGKNLPDRLRDLYANETSRPTPNMKARAVFQGSKPGDNPDAPRGLSANEIHLDYFRHVKGVDENLGRLLDALDALKISEDTVIVYTSDNGYYLGEHGLGDKRSVYEESLRIPMLVRYPRAFAKGKVIDEMVLNLDVAPTFLELAGVTIPDTMQGDSFQALAAGKKPSQWRKSFLSEYFFENGGGDTPTLVSVRTDTAKLVRYPEHENWTEVFDLSSDPYELNNLVQKPEPRAQLQTELDALLKRMQYVVPNNVGKPKK